MKTLPPVNFLSAYRDTRRARRFATGHIATVTSSNQAFNDMLCRATSDIYTLITWGEHGPYPYAGIPWFSTVFGRDALSLCEGRIALTASGANVRIVGL